MHGFAAGCPPQGIDGTLRHRLSERRGDALGGSAWQSAAGAAQCDFCMFFFLREVKKEHTKRKILGMRPSYILNS
jgi:hypothetical protein